MTLYRGSNLPNPGLNWLLFLVVLAVCIYAMLARTSDGQERSVVEPLPVLTLQQQLDVASRQTSADPANKSDHKNKNLTVPILEGRYLVDGLVIDEHVSIDPQGKGMRPVRFVYTGPDGESADNPRVVISVRGGYGKDVGNFEVRAARPDAKYLVFVEGSGGANNFYHDIRIDHLGGLDCRGLVIRDQESAYVSRIDSNCTQPLAIMSGDNHYLECLDLKAPTTDDRLAATSKDVIAVPLYLGMPRGWTIGGQNAFHGGRQIIYCESQQNDQTGNTLLISGAIRYEQPLSDSSRPAIEFNLVNRSLESFAVSGVIRSSPRTGANVGWTGGKVWKSNVNPASYFLVKPVPNVVDPKLEVVR